MTKDELRKIFKEKRAAFYKNHRASYAAHSQKICDIAGPLARAHETVSVFYPLSGEVDTRPLIQTLCDQGISVALPRISEVGLMSFHHWVPTDPSMKSSFGMKEPLASAPQCTPSLVFVPLLAYGPTGARLGYGKGHYDRYFNSLQEEASPIKIGLAFSWAQCPELQPEPHDSPLDIVVTECGLIEVLRKQGNR